MDFDLSFISIRIPHTTHNRNALYLYSRLCVAVLLASHSLTAVRTFYFWDLSDLSHLSNTMAEVDEQINVENRQQQPGFEELLQSVNE